jgi:hypothetical protein
MRFTLTVAMFVLLFGLARRFGKGPEQQVAGILLANLTLCIINVMLSGQVHFESVDRAVAFVDLASLFGFFWVALRANRIWPLLVAALQIMVMIAHLSVYIELGARTAYWGMMAVSQYLQLVVMAGGLALHHRREKRVGPYRSWRPSLPV